MKTIREWMRRIKFYPILKNDLDKVRDVLRKVDDNLLALEKKYGKLKMKVEGDLKEKALEKHWENKYPMANITHECRSLPFSKKPISVPVNLMITKHDPNIRDELIKWGLYKTGEDDETLVPKIDRKIYEKYYKYAFDESVWGFPEVWEFFFEMLNKGFKEGFDCDSFANMKASYYLAAGVPSFKVRCVGGLTNTIVDGEQMGHLTDYVLSMKTGKFHHLNSTYGQLWKTISEYPTHQDAEEGRDDVGIVFVWFSYNDKSCFHDFKSKINLDEYKIKIKKIKIK